MEDASVANIPKQFVTENSYILDPESYGEVWPTSLEFSHNTLLHIYQEAHCLESGHFSAGICRQTGQNTKDHY